MNLSTDAWYRALTEGNEEMQGNVGKKEFNQFISICDEEDRWESDLDLDLHDFSLET